MARRLFLERIGLIFLGSAILAFGVYNFYYLNNITEGGVLGILLLLKNLFNIQPAIANVVIDGLLLLVGYKFFGKNSYIFNSSFYNFFSVI